MGRGGPSRFLASAAGEMRAIKAKCVECAGSAAFKLTHTGAATINTSVVMNLPIGDIKMGDPDRSPARGMQEAGVESVPCYRIADLKDATLASKAAFTHWLSFKCRLSAVVGRRSHAGPRDGAKVGSARSRTFWRP